MLRRGSAKFARATTSSGFSLPRSSAITLAESASLSSRASIASVAVSVSPADAIRRSHIASSTVIAAAGIFATPSA
jgi:hypothetical protein